MKSGPPFIPFTNSYVQLPERFYARVHPTPVAAPSLIRFNETLAGELGIDRSKNDDALATIFSGNVIPEGAQPLAQVYAGHQFGHLTPQLGDGRALLLGEVIDSHGQRRDIQLKGSGLTLFSRNGDGRAALGPVIREYIVSEAMHALGIRTTRALAAVTTGEPVLRETVLPGAIFTRVAASHIRVGTFEYFALQGDLEAIRILADYVIDRHYPQAKQAQHPYHALLAAVVEAQASLVASWMLIGFIHGVMNTDNMTVSGETIDYGPCAFMDAYDAATVFSSIDRHGRYAYGNQPRIAQWNLARFAEAIVPLLDEDIERAIAVAEEIIGTFPATYETVWLAGMHRKLGLFAPEAEDIALISDLYGLMQAHGADFTLTFRGLSDAEGTQARRLFANAADFDAWLARWQERMQRQPQTKAEAEMFMHSANPAFIPRNHRVEAAITAAVEREDFSRMDELMTVLSRPYDNQPEFAEYANPPELSDVPYRTFCGT